MIHLIKLYKMEMKMVGLNGVDCAIDLSIKQAFEWYVFYTFNALNNLTYTKSTAHVYTYIVPPLH